MIKNIDYAKITKLKDEVTYQKGQVVSKTITKSKNANITLFAFDKDEGLFRTLKIIKNGHKKENKEQFKAMRNTFKKYKEYLGFIAIISNK